MESHWAAEQLQVIRTLMERSAIYRRALAPIMTCAGVVGLLAGLGGWLLRVQSLPGFLGYWMGVGAVAAGTAFLLVRRQALKASEPFWSLPTRRVAQGLFPAFFAGLVVSLLLLLFPNLDFLGPWALPPFWMLLYGCALQSAGFFMPRGIRLLGAIYLAGGLLLIAYQCLANRPLTLLAGHVLMGAGFGGLHLAYGIYLYFTEKGGNAA